MAAALQHALPALAAPTDLANNPLGTATGSNVLPNIFMILDDSRSMARDYMPDHVSYSLDDDDDDDNKGHRPAEKESLVATRKYRVACDLVKYEDGLGDDGYNGQYRCRDDDDDDDDDGEHADSAEEDDDELKSDIKIIATALGLSSQDDDDVQKLIKKASYYCRNPNLNYATVRTLKSYWNDDKPALIRCYRGDPPYFSSNFNSIYYNPNITYKPPVNADGTSKTSYNNSSLWAAVPWDGYGVQSAKKLNLLNEYPERKWSASSSGSCTSLQGGANPCLSAVENGVYKYPNATVKYLHTVFGSPYYYTVKVEWCKTPVLSGTDVFFGSSDCQERKVFPYQFVKYSNWSRVQIDTTNTAQMTNFANWFAWYRTRLQAAKTSISLALKDTRGTPKKGAALLLDPTDADKFHARIGLMTIRSVVGSDDDDDDEDEGSGGTNPKTLYINDFNYSGSTSQKGMFYSTLDNVQPRGFSQLRRVLSAAGRIYGGKVKNHLYDPVQYSCQQNFSILTSDGYWNVSDDDDDDSSGGGARKLNSGTVGNQDTTVGAGGDMVTGLTAGQEVPPPSFDKLKRKNTLADVSYYYYHTDLRTGTTGQCATGVGGADVCTNNVKTNGISKTVDDIATHQHMTVFTVGMGDGALKYKQNYKSSSTGDYHDILQKTRVWPDPVGCSGDDCDDDDDEASRQTQMRRIDDLWHTAVNGRGTYYSATDPTGIQTGIRGAMGTIGSAPGGAAAAATPPFNTDQHRAFKAIYYPTLWSSDLFRYNVDPDGKRSTDKDDSFDVNKMITQRVEDKNRVVYTDNGGSTGGRTDFKVGAGGLTAGQLVYFDNLKLSQNDGSSNPGANWSKATAEMLVKYLAGETQNEDRDPGTAPGVNYQRLYRYRDKPLGDIVHSQPIYVSQPPSAYTDTGYPDFANKNKNRTPRLYVAANDGMLHAIDPDSGDEKWAYIPSQVLPDLWRLADKNYPSAHHPYLDGPLTAADARIAPASGDPDFGWRSVVIGALGKGGRGFYAMDVTDPDQPKRLWSVTAEDEPNLGYSYGAPLIGKLADGTWVTVFTSGYNNIPEGGKYATADGKGYLYIRRMDNGSKIRTIALPDDAGSVSNPTGLAKINLQVASRNTDVTIVGAYGGDLLGNLWHFDLGADEATAGALPYKLIALGDTQPITVTPEVTTVTTSAGPKKMVYFGTGKYLGESDLVIPSLPPAQAIYGIKDEGKPLNPDAVKSKLVKQVISGTGSTRTVTNSAVDLAIPEVSGWYVDLATTGPDKGERVNVDPALINGALIVATTVPGASDCSAAGHSLLYQLDYKTGGKIGMSGIDAGIVTSDVIVGFSLFEYKSGATKGVYEFQGGGSAEFNPPPGLAPGSLPPKRVFWRELVD